MNENHNNRLAVPGVRDDLKGFLEFIHTANSLEHDQPTAANHDKIQSRRDCHPIKTDNQEMNTEVAAALSLIHI